MTVGVEAAIFGAIQGLTEFLPISSSGHLVLAHYFFNYQPAQPLAFDVALHVGTLLALIVYFWPDLALLIKHFFASFAVRQWTADHKLPWLILLATIPAAIFGSLLNDWFESIRSPLVVIVTLAIVGLLFLLTEARYRGYRTMSDIQWPTAMLIGLAQVLALIPGVSRSGITIVAGMTAGLKREQAARFTFLLSIPTVAGAVLKKLLDLQHQSVSAADWQAMIIGIAAAAIVGYTVIRFLLQFLSGHRLNVFAYYRLGLAVIVTLILLISGNR